MKKLIFIPLLFVCLWCKAQVNITAQVDFGTLADMRGCVGQSGVQVFLNGLTSPTDGNGGTYMWDGTNTGTDNGFTIVQVTGVTTGRWVRLPNGNTLKNIVTFSGVTLQTQYQINFSGTLPFTPALVLTQPYSQNAAAFSYVDNVTATGFRINFLTVPAVGTLNLTFGYLIIKQ